MRTLSFNENGPIIVSKEDFEIFQSNNYSDFDGMYYNWIDENNSDGVRRLIIRDLLRQASTENNPEITYYDTRQSFGRIMYIGGKNDTTALYWTLRNRPRLLEEIVSEFLYNLEHGYMPIRGNSAEDSAKLLELLLTVAKPESVKRLWQYHPLNVNTVLPLPKQMSERLRLYTGRANLPQPLREELWHRIKSDLTAAINNQENALLAEGNIPPIAENCMMDVIAKFVDGLKQESFFDSRHSAIMVTSCIALLEQKLPRSVAYLSYLDMRRVLPKITNRKLTSTSLCRHITLIPAKDLLYCGKYFLYWARGIITLHDATKTECLKKIDACLADNPDVEVVSQ